MPECSSCTQPDCSLPRKRSGLLAIVAVFGAVSAGSAQNAAPPIADNSFLLEEAYNQEKGVIQHISAFQRSWGSASWAYSFVQEWPAGGQRHQLSYTVPIQRSGTTALGDILLNWRVQAAGTDGPVSVSPRVSLILPTGSVTRGFGSGAVGVQINLPVSVTLGPTLVSHWNAGATVTPSARVPLATPAPGGGQLFERATTKGLNLGVSAIWQVSSNLNFMLETAWTRTEFVIGDGQTAAVVSWLLNPGVRWAHNFKSGLQIVPGIAFPIGIGPSNGDNGLFLYLSFEHPI